VARAAPALRRPLRPLRAQALPASCPPPRSAPARSGSPAHQPVGHCWNANCRIPTVGLGDLHPLDRLRVGTNRPASAAIKASIAFRAGHSPIPRRSSRQSPARLVGPHPARRLGSGVVVGRPPVPSALASRLVLRSAPTTVAAPRPQGSAWKVAFRLGPPGFTARPVFCCGCASFELRMTAPCTIGFGPFVRARGELLRLG
jgi:hypothetical protein